MTTENDAESTAEDTEQNDTEEQHAEILRVARERFQLAQDAEADQRRLTEEDLKFSNGEQWDPKDLKSRELDGRPSLVVNRMSGVVHQISNDIRQNRPAIKVSPVDDAADVDTAKVLQGIIRHIEYASNADNAYDTATDSAIRGGYGYFRIITDWESPTSFNQEIKIKRVPDRFAVSLDPSYQEPDGSDAEWGFVTEQVPLESFKARWPDSKITTSDQFDALKKDLGDWFQDNTVRVTEYFWKEYEDVKIVFVSYVDPQTHQRVQQTYRDDEIPADMPLDAEIIAERKTVVPKVRWAKLNGCEVLEQTEWLGSWIPLIPVHGEELVINGKKYLSGIVRHAKDSQKILNYYKSSLTEAITSAPRAPYIGPAGSFEGFENIWKTANKKNHAFLPYKPVKDSNGSFLPGPQRQSFEPAIQAISQAIVMTSDDIKATTALYDAAMGARSNEQSGVAISRRANQAQTSNFHFVDNLAKSLKHAGRIIVELIPKVYDTEREVRMLGEDSSERIVRVNSAKLAKDQQRPYDLNVGKYDVTVSVGPSYETKRQEAVASQLDFTKAMPQHAPMLADLIVKNMDWQGADEMAKRLKKMLPPNLQEDSEKGPQALPPEVQAQMQQSQQLVQQLTEQLNQAHDTIDQKRMEWEYRLKIEAMKQETQIRLKLADIQAKDAHVLLGAEIAQLERLQNQPIQDPNAQMPAGHPDQMPEQAFALEQQQLPGELPPEISMEHP